MSDIDYSAITDVLHQETQKRRALSQLLGELRGKAEHHLAIQVHMGDVASYITSVPLEWIANKVGFAADLPIFKESTEGSKRIAIDPDTIEIVQQRLPDWRRQQEMTAYLASRRHHKFPPLLLVAYQHWAYEPQSDKWAPDETATEESLTLFGLEPNGTYWDLDDSNTRFYALDGQHRLMAILGLQELIRTGSLHALDKERRPTKKPSLSIDELLQRLQDNSGGDKAAIHESMQHLMDECIGIEIVPAVISGETIGDAYRRLRQLFVDVNEHAKPLSSSEIAQLDEHHGFRIVARKLMAQHSLLRRGNGPDGGSFERVHTKNVTLPEKSPSYTTLNTLVTIAERYLVESDRPPKVSLWLSIGNHIYQRPDPESLNLGTSVMTEYFDALARLPSHEAFVRGKPAGDIRKIDENILFRPIAQTALAEAVGKLHRQGISLVTIADVLAAEEDRDQLRLTDPHTPWFGVLCDPVPPHKMRRHKRNQELCCRLLQYLLGGGIPDDVDREELRGDFANERRVDEDHAVDLDGDTVELDKVRLPVPWR